MVLLKEHRRNFIFGTSLLITFTFILTIGMGERYYSASFPIYQKALSFVQGPEDDHVLFNTHRAETIKHPQLCYKALSVLRKLYDKAGSHQLVGDCFRRFIQVRYSIQNFEKPGVISAKETLLWQEERRQIAANKNAEAQSSLNQDIVSREVLVIVLVFILVITFLLYNGYLIREKARASLQAKSLELESYRNEIRIVNDTKSKWFYSAANELKATLSVIKGSVKKISQNEAKTSLDKQDLEMLKRSTDRLANMAEEVLSLSKTEEGTISAQKRFIDLAELIDKSVSLFATTARNLGVEMEHTADEAMFMAVDPEKIIKVMVDLISTALQHTPKGGRVILSLEKEEEDVVISVANDGLGNSKKNFFNFFDYIVPSNKVNRDHSISGETYFTSSREIADLHGGSISVQGKGGVFQLRLPLRPVFDRRVAGENKWSVVYQQKETRRTDEMDQSQPVLLLLEDDLKLRVFITSLLTKHFKVVEANSGDEGLEKLARNDVKVILSDFMMLTSEGVPFLKAVKTNKKWQGLPFMHLSALKDKRLRMDAFRIGIDDYLYKPFDPDELIVRVKNLYKNYLNRIGEEHSSDPVSSDEKVIRKLRDEVLANINDNSFNVWRLANCAAMSERQIYRFLKKNTGLTPLQFIQEIKLTKAMEMIENRIYTNLNQLSSAVGFQVPAYFSSVFERRFGVKPTSLMKG